MFVGLPTTSWPSASLQDPQPPQQGELNAGRQATQAPNEFAEDGFRKRDDAV